MSTAFLHVLPHCTNVRRNRCQEDLNSCPLENWRRPPGRLHITWIKTIQQDLKSNNLTSPWMKQLTWLRIVHPEDWCLRLALHSPSGAWSKRRLSNTWSRWDHLWWPGTEMCAIGRRLCLLLLMKTQKQLTLRWRQLTHVDTGDNRRLPRRHVANTSNRSCRRFDSWCHRRKVWNSWQLDLCANLGHIVSDRDIVTSWQCRCDVSGEWRYHSDVTCRQCGRWQHTTFKQTTSQQSTQKQFKWMSELLLHRTYVCA